MTDVTLRQLQYFVAVVDHGSMTAAARAEHVSQAALSMAVAQLEKTIDIDLLIRTKSKRVVPTPQGHVFAAHARRVLAGVGDALDSVAEASAALTGTLRVGCSFTLSPRLIPELITRFDRDHPGVDIAFVEGPPADMQDEVRQGRLDVAFVYAQQAGDDLPQTHVSDVRLHLAIPAEHPLAQRTEVAVAEFIDMDAILLNVPPTIERLVSMLRAMGYEPRVRHASANMQTILSLVARGYGYSLLNSPPATNDTYDGRRLSFVPLRDVQPPNAIVAVTAGQRRMPRRVRAAIDVLTGV